MTSTIEVANGIATSGNWALAEYISIAAMASAPPMEPASAAQSLLRSIMTEGHATGGPRGRLAAQKSYGRRPYGRRP